MRLRRCLCVASVMTARAGSAGPALASVPAGSRTFGFNNSEQSFTVHHAKLKASLRTTPYDWKIAKGHLPRGLRSGGAGRPATTDTPSHKAHDMHGTGTSSARLRDGRRRAGGLALLAAAVAAGLAAPAAHAGVVFPDGQSFGYSSANQYFTVPAGVTQLHIDAWGGSGGNGAGATGLYSAPGGMGGDVSLDVAVTPGDTLLIDVGGRGGDGVGQTAGVAGPDGPGAAPGGPGGNFNTGFGAQSGTVGGGGGGGTIVTDQSTATRLVLAGGGGGGGGGGLEPGYNGGAGGDGGSSTNGTCDPTFGPGEFGNGDGGGQGGACSQAGTGTAGVSGSGQPVDSGAGTGGGGGGGSIGGDGGASGAAVGGGGGGGGAAGTSSWTSSASDVVVGNGTPGQGGVMIQWSPTQVTGTAKSATFTGGTSTFTVPAGVRQLSITGAGGTGGLGAGAAQGYISTLGGLGAQLSAIVPVNPGDQLTVDIGGAGGDGTEGDTSPSLSPVPGGSGGGSGSGQNGGSGGSVTVPDQEHYGGDTGGGGGAGTVVKDATSNVMLLDAGGGGGGGGDGDTGAGQNGGQGGNAGSPVSTQVPADGAGLYGSGLTALGTTNGIGGTYASDGATNGQTAADSTQGNFRATGGGGGGGVKGGSAGQQCTGALCAASAGGGGAGSSALGVTATLEHIANSVGGNGRVTISWIEPPLVLAAPGTLKGYAGSAFSAALAATGGVPPYTWTVTSGSLPAGLKLAGTGTISGTPTSTGTTTFKVKAVDNGNPADSATESVTITIAPQTLIITTTSLPAGTVGTAYTRTLGAAMGKGALTWSITSGTLPAGLTLTAKTGVISGKPTTAGTTTLTFKVTDSSTPAMTATAKLPLTINPSLQAAVFVTQGGYSGVESFPLNPTSNQTPLTLITGSATGLNGTTAVAVSPAGTVFVVSANNDTIASYPYGATGNTAPTSTISGANTDLAYPTALSIDGANGDLYVTDSPADSVTAYAPGATGNVSPVVDISGSNTGLDLPTGLTFDANGNLWVANQSNNSLEEFAPGATGNVAPEAIIAGTATGLDGPSALTLDSSNNLLVANTYGESLTEYSPAVNGNVAPLRTITGSSTGLSFPDGIDVDANGDIWVANEFAGLTAFASGASGNTAPFATVGGSNTGLSAPDGVAVAPPLSIRTTKLAPARLHRHYHAKLKATLGTTPYRWKIAKGHLPPGLKLRRGTGVISGVPRKTGTFRFRVKVTDSTRRTMTATQRLSITVRGRRTASLRRPLTHPLPKGHR